MCVVIPCSPLRWVQYGAAMLTSAYIKPLCVPLTLIAVGVGGCGPSLSQNFKSTLPGGDTFGRKVFGVEYADAAKVVVLDTTGIDSGDVFDAQRERFDGYLNEGLVPVGKSISRDKGQGRRQAVLLAAVHGASLAEVEIKDPLPYEKTIETHVPTLVTESVHIDGTTDFRGNITRIGWGPGTTNVWVDPYFIECRLWAKRAWPPLLGVYFTEEMRAFNGFLTVSSWSTMKSAADRWRLRHPDEPVPPRGAEVKRIIPGSAAKRYGLHRRDILVMIDGQPIADEAAARIAITAGAGREVEIVVMRQFARDADATASGWDVSTPKNPLFQDGSPTPWRRLARRIIYPIVSQ